MSDRPTRILVAADGSEDAALAVQAAIDISEKTSSELHVVHTWRNPRAPSLAPHRPWPI